MGLSGATPTPATTSAAAHATHSHGPRRRRRRGRAAGAGAGESARSNSSTSATAHTPLLHRASAQPHDDLGRPDDEATVDGELARSDRRYRELPRQRDRPTGLARAWVDAVDGIVGR